MLEVTINKCTWTIVEVDGQSAMLSDGFFFGRTFFFDKKICINANISEDQKRKTLAHELCHAFLSETQIHYHDKNDEPYTEEMLCEFVGHYAESILKIVDQYFDR